MESGTAVFVDVDGVLLDVSRRYHAVYADILGQLGGSPAGLEEFMALKREKASVQELTGLPDAGAKEFQRRWNQLVEGPAYLELDRWMPQARTALLLLAASYNVVAFGLRRKPDALRAQLKSLSCPKVAQVRAAAPQGDAARKKAGLIESSPFFSRNAIVVGDTETDIRAGKELGLTTVAVRGGLRTDALLARESPDLTLDGMADLPGVLRRLMAGGRP